jgi:aspartate/methionine/tyrosine aminotransferase
VYGEVKDFKSINFTVKLYEFSQEMQINALKQALEEFFQKAEASELIALFDIFVTTGNQEGLLISKAVINHTISHKKYIFQIFFFFF